MRSNAVRIQTTPDWFEEFNISLGFIEGKRIHLSGQAAIDPQTGEIVGEGDFDKQVEQTFQNIETVLDEVDSGLDQIVKVQIYLTDMSFFPRVVEYREEYFTEPYPADTIVEINSLALPELMIEMDAMALLNGKRVEQTN